MTSNTGSSGKHRQRLGGDQVEQVFEGITERHGIAALFGLIERVAHAAVHAQGRLRHQFVERRGQQLVHAQGRRLPAQDQDVAHLLGRHEPVHGIDRGIIVRDEHVGLDAERAGVLVGKPVQDRGCGRIEFVV
jgi:hypothetical protein